MDYLPSGTFAGAIAAFNWSPVRYDSVDRLGFTLGLRVGVDR